MMKKTWIAALVFVLALVWMVQKNLPESVAVVSSNSEADKAYELDEPAAFPAMLVPEHNSFDPEVIALGRSLFFDPILSKDSTLSCSTCHNPGLSFSDKVSKSISAIGIETRRNAPSLANVGYVTNTLFWDGAVASLEEQVVRSIEDTTEMAYEWPAVILKLQNHPEYSESFVALFGLRNATHIRPYHVARAIAQFERTLISGNSPYDQYMAGLATLSEAEMRGLAIFFDFEDDLPNGECNHCHMDPFFTDFQFLNNGIQTPEAWESNPDMGRSGVTKKPFDRGKFRIPTLRNIALTAPYMHDGSMATLEEVVEHYNLGGYPAVNSSVNVRPLGLSARDKSDLIAFLHTLTDSTFLNNPNFQRP